jgi:ubiquinone/menaquinone biosynthesis C-methylase UbiE
LPDGSIPFPDQSFNLVTARWVLEHVESPQHFLAEVKRVLVPGGQFIALTVNAVHYVTLLVRLFHLLPHAVTQGLVRRLYGRASQDTFRTHYRMNTPAAVRRQARRAGLEVVSITRLANPDYFRFWRPMRSAAVLLDWLLERAGTELGRVYMIVSLRRPL